MSAVAKTDARMRAEAELVEAQRAAKRARDERMSRVDDKGVKLISHFNLSGSCAWCQPETWPCKRLRNAEGGEAEIEAQKADTARLAR